MSATPLTSIACSDENITDYLASGALSPDGLTTSRESVLDTVWRDRLDKLARLSLLADDWDGMGATKPQPQLVESAAELIRLLRDRDLSPPSRIVASPTGSIVIEWQSLDIYIEAEITKPYHVEYMLERPHQPAKHWEEDFWPVAEPRRRSAR